MDFLWIIAGILYVSYKLITEEKNYTPIAALIVLFVIFPILGALIGMDVPSIVIGIICILSPVIVIALIFLFRKPDEVKHEENLQRLKDDFQKCGYRNIPTELYEKLLSHPHSPLRYNNPTVFSCYTWLCQEQTRELTSLKSDQIAEMLNVNLSDIPLVSGKAIDEANMQRKMVLMEIILKRQGLTYNEISHNFTHHMKSLYLSNYEYQRTVEKIVSEKQNRQG
jgi:hypothetical protein